MGLIGESVAILDVANAEAFVQRCIDKSTIRYDSSEREELLAEGLTILYELAGKYKPLPMRPGIDKKAGRFSGYAAMFLPRRLGDAWHKSHPEHLYITDPESGKRGWHYGAGPLSLDSLTESANPGDSYGGERHLLHARTITSFCHAATVALFGRPSARTA